MSLVIGIYSEELSLKLHFLGLELSGVEGVQDKQSGHRCKTIYLLKKKEEEKRNYGIRSGRILLFTFSYNSYASEHRRTCKRLVEQSRDFSFTWLEVSAV